MLGASRRSPASVARFRGAASCRALSPSVSSPDLTNKVSGSEHGAPQLQKRLFTLLSAPNTLGFDRFSQSNPRESITINRRYESNAAAVDSSDSACEKFEYQAEVNRLMDLIVHSLYSNKEVFLRELVSNASDALDKLRYLSVTEPDLLKDGVDLDVRIQTDKDNGIITITDSGIGMTKEELVNSLGTIAHSGTAKFLKALKESQEAGTDSNLIGQFGVGFYSAFLVSDKVVVSTKSPKSDKQYVWEGEAGSSSYTVREETDPANLIPRGTRLTLYLKREDRGFAHPEKIQKLVKNYSQFVSFPIYMWQEKGHTKEVEVEEEDPTEAKKEGDDGTTGEKKKKTKTVIEKYWDWELTNETQPLWLRSPKEVTTQEYNEFFRKTFKEYLDPLASSHFTTEGEVEFRSMLFVPSVKKEELMESKTKNIRLYVKRVFISDDFDGELFPRYLSFVKGVVDSNDLPLNVSREILQESRIVRIMRKRLVRKAFDMILGISLSENKDDYDRFWENFGKFIKLGCMEDKENHKRIAPLLRFFSNQSENELISLDEYVENMKPEQNGIYYIAADSVTSAKNAPFLERLTEKQYEVLFLVDPMDEVAIQSLKSYKEKNFVDISKEDLDLGDKNEEREKEIKQEFSKTCDWIKNRLGDKVARVDISHCLSSSPCVLVSGKFGWSANMKGLMGAQTMGDTTGLDFMRSRRVFESNPEHPIIKSLNDACEANPEDPEALRAVDVLFETARLTQKFARKTSLFFSVLSSVWHFVMVALPLRSRSLSAMEIRVWASRLRSTARCRSSPLPLPLPLPIAGNFDLYSPPFYQLRSPQSATLSFIPVSRFSSAKVLELSRLSEMIRGMGFREETIERLLDKLPAAVLKDSDGFRKKIELLRCFFGLSLPEIDQILFDFPDYLMLGFEARLKPLVDEIHRMDLNFSPSEIRAAVLEHTKPLLGSEPGELSRCIALVDNLRCRYVIKERILSKGYLRAAIDVKLRIECLREHGLIVRDAFKVLHVEPRVILYDLHDIKEKIGFLLNNMGFRVEHLVECPEYLGVNLEKQIVPRHNVFEYLRSVGGLGDEVWMKHYVKLSRMKFYNMFVKPYPECERIFNGCTREKRARPRHPVGMWKLFKPQRFEQSATDDRNMREFMKSLR